MRTLVLLCDAAQVADGKLYIIGGGWSVCGPDPMPSAVAMRISVDPSEFGVTHTWQLALEDADGAPVSVPVGELRPVVAVTGDFVATGEGGSGLGVDVPIAVTFGPIPLAPGQRYTWRLLIDGETLPGGLAAFTVQARA